MATHISPPRPGRAPVVVDRATDPAVAGSVAALLDEFLGDGLHDPDDIAGTIADPSGGVVVTAYSTGAFIGAATAHVGDQLDRQSLAELWPTGRPALPGRFGMLDSAVLRPGWRGQGIGRQLAEQRISHLAAVGVDAVVAYSWESGAAHRSRPVLEKIGFQPVVTVGGVWSGIPCPHCGSSCGCDATIEMLLLH